MKADISSTNILGQKSGYATSRVKPDPVTILQKLSEFGVKNRVNLVEMLNPSQSEDEKVPVEDRAIRGATLALAFLHDKTPSEMLATTTVLANNSTDLLLSSACIDVIGGSLGIVPTAPANLISLVLGSHSSYALGYVHNLDKEQLPQLFNKLVSQFVVANEKDQMRAADVLFKLKNCGLLIIPEKEMLQIVNEVLALTPFNGAATAKKILLGIINSNQLSTNDMVEAFQQLRSLQKVNVSPKRLGKHHL